MSDDFPRRLRFLLDRHGMRPIDLARRLSVDKAAVSRWLTGETKRPRATIEVVAGAFGLTVVEFYAAMVDA